MPIKFLDFKGSLEDDLDGLFSDDGNITSSVFTVCPKLYAVINRDLIASIPDKYEGVVINLNPKSIQTSDGVTKPNHTNDPSATEKIQKDWLAIELRKLDYCDADGNEKKIIVFASQPFSEDEQTQGE
jgi:hypothetical protein